jgi:transcriptional regulator with XRE-family HTH domain
MQLTQPEMIQILRKRANLNQAELGSRAFDTNMDSGRTKIKNIELGRQRPTENDLRQMAACLDVPFEQLLVSADGKTPPAGLRKGAVLMSQKVIDMFPDLGNYLEMLEKAAGIDDYELVEYLAGKIGDILHGGPVTGASPDATITSDTEGRVDRG